MIASTADLVAFLKVFHRRWLADPSLDAALIPPDLPPPLATVYRELGALTEIAPGPFATQDGLVPPGRLKRLGGMVEFAWENSGNWSARCPLGQADPPVYSAAADIWETPRRGFVVVCDSLAHFLTTLCLQEAVMSCRNLVNINSTRPPAELLTVPLEPLWLGGRYVDGRADHHFWVSPDREVLVMDWAGVWVGSPSRAVAGLLAPGVAAQVLE